MINQEIINVLKFYADNWKVYYDVDCWGDMEQDIRPNVDLFKDKGKKAKELLKLLESKEVIITYDI